MQPSTEFLTPEECALVDAALLTSRDKFTTRVSIYALRSLQEIALAKDCAIADLAETDIIHWIHSDPSLEAGIDDNFRAFFARLVLSSLAPLQQIAASTGFSLEEVNIQHVIHWFEGQAKENFQNTP
ncbi:MAG: hypothetical protein VKJ24_03885 [Synechococcales bacterium]|nr:hypothetical protein [Synechococcales bacterium]